MDAFFAEDKPGKQEVVALILEMAEKQPAWRASLLSALETGILRTMSENAEGAATLRHVTNKWALLLALYQKNRDASCCASVFSLVAWCVRSIQTLQPALLSLSLSLCFSLVDVLTQEHANALFLSKSKYVVMNLSERMDVLDGEAAFSCALFLLWLVQNEEFALASSRQCVIWACILLAKRVVVLLESEEEGDVVREATAGRESMPDVVPIPSEVEKEIRDDEDKVEGEKEPSVVEAAADAIHNPRGVAYYVLSTLVRVVEAVAAVVSSEDLMMYCKSVEEARAEEAWDANCSEDRVCDSRSVFLYKETVVQFIVRSPLLLSSSGGGRCGV